MKYCIGIDKVILDRIVLIKKNIFNLIDYESLNYVNIATKEEWSLQQKMQWNNFIKTTNYVRDVLYGRDDEFEMENNNDEVERWAKDIEEIINHEEFDNWLWFEILHGEKSFLNKISNALKIVKK